MNNLTLFEDHSGYVEYVQSEDFTMPNVSYCVEQNEVHYNPENLLMFNQNYRRFMELLECAVEQNKIENVSSLSDVLNLETVTDFGSLRYTYGHLIDYLFENNKVEYTFNNPSMGGEGYFDGSYVFTFTATPNDYKQFLAQENGGLVSFPNNAAIWNTEDEAVFSFSSLAMAGECPNFSNVYLAPFINVGINENAS